MRGGFFTKFAALANGAAVAAAETQRRRHIATAMAFWWQRSLKHSARPRRRHYTRYVLSRSLRKLRMYNTAAREKSH